MAIARPVVFCRKLFAANLEMEVVPYKLLNVYLTHNNFEYHKTL